MKIIIAVLDITLRGGIERTTTLIANSFVKHGHDVEIISIFKEMQSFYYELDNRVHVSYLTTLSYKAKYNFWKKVLWILYAYWKMLLKIYRTNFDFIIAQSFFVSLLLWGIGSCKKTIACEHFKYALYNKPMMLLRTIVYRTFLKVVTLTKSDCEKFKEDRVDAIVIPNMVSFSSGNQVAELTSYRIIAVGRLHYQKGFDRLLRIAERVLSQEQNWRIDIYGEGELRENLVNECDKLGLHGKVCFRGFSDNIRNELLNSSILIMTSRYEGFPMILLEAMSVGLPIVSFACPEGPAELLSSGAGLLVENGDLKEFEDKLLYMMRDINVRKACSIQGKREIHRYSEDNIYASWNELFKSAVR
ncbi:glycosyltransferase family 4 protein [uncultured Bacteroides sp.]|jgi:wfgE|uniref:glycosyltransferase family 4 protein n=1 Tax=uncultured Bacteroides sp. TaxID=162156 RepID=UPI00280A9601|nr:glycosyltransferase family 4 protein [uncultured Bacteroides sp.]